MAITAFNLGGELQFLKKELTPLSWTSSNAYTATEDIIVYICAVHSAYGHGMSNASISSENGKRLMYYAKSSIDHDAPSFSCAVAFYKLKAGQTVTVSGSGGAWGGSWKYIYKVG